MQKRKDEYIMTSYREITFNSMSALNVNAINTKDGNYLDAYYLIDKGIIVSFYGLKEKYGDYKKTIDSIVIGG